MVGKAGPLATAEAVHGGGGPGAPGIAGDFANPIIYALYLSICLGQNPNTSDSSWIAAIFDRARFHKRQPFGNRIKPPDSLPDFLCRCVHDAAHKNVGHIGAIKFYRELTYSVQILRGERIFTISLDVGVTLYATSGSSMNLLNLLTALALAVPQPLEREYCSGFSADFYLRSQLRECVPKLTITIRSG